MDSKLVVEQMSGRWQIKHPDLRPLAAEARQAARALGRVTYTWMPRERNKHADRLANEAMDAAAGPAGTSRGTGRRMAPGPMAVGAALRAGGCGDPGPSCSGERLTGKAGAPILGGGRAGRAAAPGRAGTVR